MEHDILVNCAKTYETVSGRDVITHRILTSTTTAQNKKITCSGCSAGLEIGISPKFKFTKRRKADMGMFAIGYPVGFIVMVLCISVL